MIKVSNKIPLILFGSLNVLNNNCFMMVSAHGKKKQKKNVSMVKPEHIPNSQLNHEYVQGGYYVQIDLPKNPPFYLFDNCKTLFLGKDEKCSKITLDQIQKPLIGGDGTGGIGQGVHTCSNSAESAGVGGHVFAADSQGGCYCHGNPGGNYPYHICQMQIPDGIVKSGLGDVVIRTPNSNNDIVVTNSHRVFLRQETN